MPLVIRRHGGETLARHLECGILGEAVELAVFGSAEDQAARAEGGGDFRAEAQVIDEVLALSRGTEEFIFRLAKKNGLQRGDGKAHGGVLFCCSRRRPRRRALPIGPQARGRDFDRTNAGMT